MNFGESLAYWYFRLNGFLPLSNFVLHRPEAPRRHNADSDLLAVRFPHVFEEIGGQRGDWDNDRFAQWGVNHFNRIACVIVEIKTGEYNEDDVNRAFRIERVGYALRRLGTMPQEQSDDVSRRLSNEAVVHHGEYCFAKVLVSSLSRRTGVFDNTTPHHHLELQDTLTFIRNRMRRYRAAKQAARMFFPGDLIQFFAWAAGFAVDDAQVEPDEE